MYKIHLLYQKNYENVAEFRDLGPNIIINVISSMSTKCVINFLCKNYNSSVKWLTKNEIMQLI